MVGWRKATGSLTEVSWAELIHFMQPGSITPIRPLAAGGSAFSKVGNPRQTPADVARGDDTFRTTCGECHGEDGRGGTGPDLTVPGRHGSSDWALYRVVARGVPGTPMVGRALGEEATWQVVAYLQALRTGTTSANEDGADAPGVPPPVTAERVLNAEADSGNWLTYSGSYRSWRHSRLRQVDRRMVHDLRLIWTYQTWAPGQAPFESSPLVADGRMYLTEPWTNRVTALDAATGARLWQYTPRLPEALRLCCGRVNRGVALLDTLLFVGTLDARLIALDTETGRLAWEATVADYQQGYSITSAPLVVKDLVIIGVGGGEFGIRGFLDAYEAGTGRRRWRFHTIPPPGEPGSETWPAGEAWRSGGGPTWLTGSYDPGLDLLYWGTGNPAPDFSGADRAGDNLYTNSVIALDPDSGHLAWHFQFTPHDLHDWDANQIPVLVDAAWQGRTRPLMLWANRNGFYYVLDRSNGSFLGASPFVEQTWADSIDARGRPWERASARPTPAGTLVSPAPVGATSWWSPAYNPDAGLFYVLARQGAATYYPGDDEALEAHRPGEWLMGGAVSYAPGHRIVTLLGLDPLTGQRRWAKGVHSPDARDATADAGGVMSTGGGLVMAGAGTMFRAHDAGSGAVLWQINLGGSIRAAPVTYLAGGEQLVSIAAGTSVFTFGLRRPPPHTDQPRARP